MTDPTLYIGQQRALSLVIGGEVDNFIEVTWPDGTSKRYSFNA